MKKYSKLMAVLLVVAMLLPGIAQAAPVTEAEQAKVMRIAGDSRVGTSIKVSEVAMDSATDAVLVGYSGEADALTGAIVAKAKNAPLFYVRDNEVEAVKARLDDLGVANVHVLGGTTVFTEKLMKEFDAYNPVRIDGDNRYETAINAAKVAVGDKADTVFLAKGNETLADALSIGAISAKENTPLLLTHGMNLTEVTKQALKDMEVKKIEIIGGKSAVSEEIKEELEGLGYTVNRTAGDTRQATSVEIAKKFNPDAKEIVIANGFDYADAVTAGYFAAGRDAVVLLTNQNLVHPSVKEFLEDNKLDTTVLGGTSVIAKGTFDKVVEYLDGVVVEMPEEEEEIELAVESVSAINAKTLEVTFNKAADVKDADFAITKGTVKTNIANIAFSEDKTVATIELTSRMTEGEYTVTVAQEDAEDLVAKVKVENEKVAEIKVLSEVAPFERDSKTKATATVQILNQYGEDVTKLNAADVTATPGGVATKAELDAKGKLTFTVPETAKEGDKVVVTLVHGKTGVNTQATLELSGKPLVSEITFGELYNKDAKTLSQDTNTTKDKFYLPVETKDQYGEEVEDIAVINKEVLFTNTNPAIVTLANANKVKNVTIDGEEVAVLEIDGTGLAGTVNIVAVSTTSGKSATASIVVKEGVTFASISIGQPAKVVTADKNAYFPLTVIDSNGNEITTEKELEAIGQDGLNNSANSKIVYEDADKNKGLFLEVKADDITKDQAVTVSVTTKKGKVATQTVIAKADTKATVITGIDAKKATALRENGNGEVINNTDLIIEDQYGQVITEKNILEEIKFTAEATNAASKKAFDVTDGAVKAVTVKPVKNTTETSGKVVFKLDLAKTTDVEASAFEQTFRIVKDSEFESYKVEDIDPIHVIAATGDNKYKVAEGYDKEIVVKATTTDGEVVKLLKGTDFTVVGKVDYAEDSAETVTIKENETSVTKTARITINKTGEELTKEITYSNVTPKVADVKIVKAGSTVDDGNTLDSDELAKVKEVSTAKYTGTSAINKAALAGTVDFVVTDTYGLSVASTDLSDAGVIKEEKVTLTLSNGSEKVVFNNENGTKTAAVLEYIAGSTFDAVIKIDGVSSNKIKVTTENQAATITERNASNVLIARAKTAIEAETYSGAKTLTAETVEAEALNQVNAIEIVTSIDPDGTENKESIAVSSVTVEIVDGVYKAVSGETAASYTFKVKVSQGTGTPVTTKTLTMAIATEGITDGTGNVYDTIQEAIDAATVGETISVPAGTYSEALTINGNLTLQGADGATLTGGVAVTSGDVTIKGFTIKDKGLTAGNVGSLTVEGNTFSEIRDKMDNSVNTESVIALDVKTASGSVVINNNVFSGIGETNGTGTAIRLRSVSGKTDITNNTIEDVTKNAINTYSHIDDIDMTITGNTITNWDSDKDSADIGGRAIRIEFNSKNGSAIINNNTLTPPTYTGTPVDSEYVKITGSTNITKDFDWGSVNSEKIVVE